MLNDTPVSPEHNAVEISLENKALPEQHTWGKRPYLRVPMYYSLTWFDATLVYRFNECHGYRRNYNSETQPFDTLGHIFAKLKDPVESTPFILFLDCDNTNTSDEYIYTSSEKKAAN